MVIISLRDVVIVTGNNLNPEYPDAARASHEITLPLWEERDSVETKPPKHPIANSGIMAPMTAEWGALCAGPKCY